MNQLFGWQTLPASTGTFATLPAWKCPRNCLARIGSKQGMRSSLPQASSPIATLTAWNGKEDSRCVGNDPRSCALASLGGPRQALFGLAAPVLFVVPARQNDRICRLTVGVL